MDAPVASGSTTARSPAIRTRDEAVGWDGTAKSPTASPTLFGAHAAVSTANAL